MKLEISKTLIKSTALTDQDLKNALAASLYQQGRMRMGQTSTLSS